MKNKIREFIDKRGLSVYRFRQEVGVAQKTAYDLCNNPDQLPSSTVLKKICDTYEVQPNEVLIWVKTASEEQQS